MRPVLLFDIETIPDHWMARKITGLDTLPDEVAQDPTAMARLFPPKNEGEAFSFPKPLYHQVVEVSACLINSSAEVLTLRHLSTAVSSEADLLRDFWQLFERNAGISISTFNGRKFDVPVLTQRALYNGVSPTALYRGNYRNRFSGNHIDLADVLSDFGASPMLTQHEAAMMLGVPGKVGVEGGDVAALWKQGKRVDIATYCTCDTATLTLCYAWFGVAAGWCSQDEAAQIESGVKSVLEQQDHPLYSQFLAEMHR